MYSSKSGGEKSGKFYFKTIIPTGVDYQHISTNVPHNLTCVSDILLTCSQLTSLPVPYV